LIGSNAQNKNKFIKTYMKNNKDNYKVYIDGVSRGKRGPAGIGILILNSVNEEICRISEFVENASPDQIQFKAFVRSLDEISKRKISFADIYSHSETMVRQLQGIYRIMDPVIKQLKNVVSRQFSNTNFDIHLVSASKNKIATQLAEDAIKKELEKDLGAPLIKMTVDDSLKPTEQSLTDVQCSAGGVVYKREGHKIRICLIAKKGKTVWALPKGRVNEGETPEQTAVREVLEETGHLAKVQLLLDQIDYNFYWKDNNTFYHKYVFFYLMALEKENAGVRDTEAEAVAWLSPGEALSRATYLNEREIIKKSQDYFIGGK
jgi:8-oxo-dGTP diphosphatase